MSVQLLDKARKINKLLHNYNSSKIVFSDICDVLSEILDSNVVVIAKSGKILGISIYNEIEPIGTEMGDNSVGTYVDKMLNERLLEVLSTKENVNLMTLGFESNKSKQYDAIITPIDIACERLGTIFIYRIKKSYNIDDIILSEYGSVVFGLEMTRSVSEEEEDNSRKRTLLNAAINSLSESEKKAVRCVLKELNGKEGVVITSRIAEREGITRSVLINALRKFESGRIIETHSNGMRGTYIKVVNDIAYEVLGIDNM